MRKSIESTKIVSADARVNVERELAMMLEVVEVVTVELFDVDDAAVELDDVAVELVDVDDAAVELDDVDDVAVELDDVDDVAVEFGIKFGDDAVFLADSAERI